MEKDNVTQVKELEIRVTLLKTALAKNIEKYGDRVNDVYLYNLLTHIEALEKRIKTLREEN